MSDRFRDSIMFTLEQNISTKSGEILLGMGTATDAILTAIRAREAAAVKPWREALERLKRNYCDNCNAPGPYTCPICEPIKRVDDRLDAQPPAPEVCEHEPDCDCCVLWSGCDHKGHGICNDFRSDGQLHVRTDGRSEEGPDE